MAVRHGSQAHVRYLGVSQDTYARQSSSFACATISLYSCLFLAYSKDPTVPSVLTWFRYAAAQWDNAVQYKNALVRCELVTSAYERNAYINHLLLPGGSYNGLSVKNQNLGENLEGYIIYGSVLEAMKELGKRAGQLPLHQCIAFTFTRGLYTLGGVVRSLGEGLGVIIHFIDPHNRILPFATPPPGLPYGSAVWVTADTMEEAVAAIEAIYPPHDPLEPVPEDEETRAQKDLPSVPTNMSSTSRQKVGETRLLHPGQFEIRTFVPRYTTPAQAEKAAQQLYIENNAL